MADLTIGSLFSGICWLDPLKFVGYDQAFPAPLVLAYHGDDVREVAHAMTGLGEWTGPLRRLSRPRRQRTAQEVVATNIVLLGGGAAAGGRHLAVHKAGQPHDQTTGHVPRREHQGTLFIPADAVRVPIGGYEMTPLEILVVEAREGDFRPEIWHGSREAGDSMTTIDLLDDDGYPTEELLDYLPVCPIENNADIDSLMALVIKAWPWPLPNVTIHCREVA